MTKNTVLDTAVSGWAASRECLSGLGLAAPIRLTDPPAVRLSFENETSSVFSTGEKARRDWVFSTLGGRKSWF